MRFDLHVHSDRSNDSRNDVAEVLETCVRNGIDGVAIMDHNSLEGSRKAIALKREDIMIIPGVEISSSQGHILAYNVHEEIPRDLEAGETIDLIRSQGGIAVAAHPYRIWSGLGEEVTLANDFDAIEVHNARSAQAHNERAAQLAVRMCRPFTAGSDSHEPETVGSAYFISKRDCYTVEDIIREVLSGEGSIDGRHRPRSGTLVYGAKCISQWLGRGAKRM